MPRSPEADIAIVGAGPAGAALALALVRLDYRVAVVAVPRRFDACEGISERALAGMRAAGFAQALAGLAPPSPRRVDWAGVQRSTNSERLLARASFDRGLWADLQAAGVACIAARAERIEAHEDGAVRVHWTRGSLRARLVADARGRAAPRGQARLRGPETVSLLQRWQGSPGEAASCVSSFPDGWAWLARRADGARYTQLTLAAATPGLPKREGLEAWLRARLEELPPVCAWIAGCEPSGAPVARSSTAILHSPLWERGVLRVGDAAMAVDPLSGNGIFQALSSASVAPAVINTLLRDAAHAALAIGFYEERVRHVFERFARIGRDFYASETQWAAHPFWQARAAWPDATPAHDAGPPRLLGTALRPVVEHGFIREREVALTTEQPLGVWRVADVEIAPLLRELPLEAGARAAALGARIESAGQGSAARVAALQGWLREHGLLP